MFPTFGKLPSIYLSCDTVRKINFWPTNRCMWEQGRAQQFGESSGPQSLECSVWVSLVELNVVIPNKAGVERHEKGWAASSLTLVLGWFCHSIPWVSTLNVVHMLPEDLALLSQRGPKWGVCWADSGNHSQHVCSERSLHACGLWLFTLCKHTDTHTHTHRYTYLRLCSLGAL